MLQACNMISLFGTMLLQLIHHNAHAFFTSVASAMSSFLSAGIHFLKTWLAHSANFCLWSNGKHRCELRGQFQAWTGRTWWGSHLRRIVRPGTRSEALWPASKAIEIKQTGRRCLLHRSSSSWHGWHRRQAWTVCWHRAELPSPGQLQDRC